MYPSLGVWLHVSGTFFTSYVADIANPAWLYIVLRGLTGERAAVRPVSRWFTTTRRGPELAAGAILLAGIVNEVGQLFWPTNKFFLGTFDPLDFVAYAAGVVPCYLIDRRLRHIVALSSVQDI